MEHLIDIIDILIETNIGKPELIQQIVICLRSSVMVKKDEARKWYPLCWSQCFNFL